MKIALTKVCACRNGASWVRVGLRLMGSFGLIFFSLVAGFGFLEVACRLLQEPQRRWDWTNRVETSRVNARKVQDYRSAYIYDEKLGFKHQADYKSEGLNFDSNGFRRVATEPQGLTLNPPILATGDSYTKGDEVNDEESWPAQLQVQTRWKVVNAGVGAYGLDQTVLFTETLVKQITPAVLIVGFIADDVRRIEMSRLWGREKPYFELRGENLVLRNVPVPMPLEPRATLSVIQYAIGWSVLVDTVLDRLNIKNEWHVDQVRALSSGEGEKIACPLMRRIAALGLPTLVVAQYLPTAWDSASSGTSERRIAGIVLECASRAGLATLDVYDAFEAAVQAGGRDAVYAKWHPNVYGYRLIAQEISNALERHWPNLWN